jgi:hypothetical protein
MGYALHKRARPFVSAFTLGGSRGHFVELIALFVVEWAVPFKPVWAAVPPSVEFAVPLGLLFANPVVV